MSLMTTFARWLMKRVGWRIAGALPDIPRMIVIVAPHTSNWDLPVGLLCAFAVDVFRGWQFGFMMKESVFRWPIGGLMRRLGGIPIDRAAAHAAVDQMTRTIRSHDRFLLVITPEGTRKRTAHWKSGFYHMAVRAGVPVVPTALDYGRRECKIGPAMEMSGDVERDLEGFRRFFGGVQGKRPERAGEITFPPRRARA
jgi:1-acyl-sn-glycerol-3-phosphate acyltransferase